MNLPASSPELPSSTPAPRHPYRDLHLQEPLVAANPFIGAAPRFAPLPTYAEAKALLPRPFWEGQEPALACWDKTWELAFKNLRNPTAENGFVSPFIDTAFNGCLFLWDSVFILLFCRYGLRAFDFQQTLDNLYAKQHPDGFITRELRQATGQDQFHRHDPVSTGPNLFAFCEWEYFLNSGDAERLGRIFPGLLAYHRWTRLYRTWPDGSYWSSGWGCGMDNQPRVPGDNNYRHAHHNHMAWVDATFQALLSARLLASMGRVLGREPEIRDMEEEARFLSAFVHERLWNEKEGFYCDRLRDGSLSAVVGAAGFWALHDENLSPERLKALTESLTDPRRFNRHHRVPTLSASDPDYKADGGYWRGGVWPPTNYMVLRGLTVQGEDDLAHAIGRNHHRRVVEVFEKTGTVWENYAPEASAIGNPAKPDFVGWSGLGPVAVFLEYVLGLRPDVPKGRLLWDIRLLEAHGVTRYPFGRDGLLDLRCPARRSGTENPEVEIRSNRKVEIELRWEGGSRVLSVRPD